MGARAGSPFKEAKEVISEPAPSTKDIPRENATQSEPVLSQRQYEILQAMNTLKATDPARRKTTEKIALTAEGPEANPEGFKRPNG